MCQSLDPVEEDYVSFLEGSHTMDPMDSANIRVGLREPGKEF